MQLQHTALKTWFPVCDLTVFYTHSLCMGLSGCTVCIKLQAQVSGISLFISFKSLKP